MQLFASRIVFAVASLVLLLAIDCAAQASVNASMLALGATDSLVPVLALVDPSGSFDILYEWDNPASIYDRAIAPVSNNTVIALVETFMNNVSDPIAAQTQLFILSNATSSHWKPVSVWNISDVSASVAGLQYHAGLIYVLLTHSHYPAQPSYELIVVNQATGAMKSLHNFSIAVKASDSFGLAYSPTSGWLSSFFSFYNGTNPNNNSLLIWNYNPSSGQEVVQMPNVYWYANLFAYSSAMQKFVAIAGVGTNYGDLNIVTYTPPAAAPVVVCHLPSNLGPGLFCIGQTWLSMTGVDIYMVDCYYTRLLHFDLNCNLISQVPLQQQIGSVSLINAPMAFF